MQFKGKVSSPSHRYVAICYKTNFDGVYFRKFDLPARDYEGEDNNTERAAWFFLNVLNMSACIEGVITEEDYLNIKEE